MLTAHDIAGDQYQKPNKDTKDAGRLRYSIYASEILHFFVLHRVALATHVQRFRPDLFKTARDSRAHLQTLAAAGDLTILTYNDPRRPNVYLITDQGFDRASDFMQVPPESIPGHYDEPKGDHILHELLITEVAVSRYDVIRTNPAFKHLWHERFGFFSIDAFTNVVPDFAHAFRSPHGDMIDFIEVLSGVRSITNVKEKLQKWGEWTESEEAKEFLINKYKSFGSKNPKPTFRFTIVAHNRNLIGADHGWERQVLNATFYASEEIQKRTWTTTNAALRHAGSIDSPVWRSAATLVPHRAKWDEKPKKDRSKLTAEILRETPTYSLFSVPAPA